MLCRRYTNGENVTTVIYLDQNVISDLRMRKIQEMNDHKACQMRDLFKILASRDMKVVYSHITLSEINQIENPRYKQEHIEVLNLLGAVYIEPVSGIFSPHCVDVVWKNYLAIMQDNLENGCNDIELVNRKLVQKVHGLDVPETFEEIYIRIKNELIIIAQQEQDFLESFDYDKLEVNAQLKYKERMSDLEKLRFKISSSIPDEIQCSPQVFRELPQMKGLELKTLPVEDVVKQIESYVYLQNGGAELVNNFANSKQGLISRAYSLMNWAGYHADDFQKSAREFGDRLRASLNDMSHVASAVCADVILTEDKGMLAKAPACYAYMGKNIKVSTVSNFLTDV
ncbi:hypothetical protein A1Q5_19525 [Aliivibrio logei 5S-186]|uniref:DUF4935 domain-containing protein n=1 Tax=Aliivibrio logei 5S-186 TaxID=626086 RepID=A0ABX3AX19_ALILO|nr:hypothetical protein A1Q5_19525 [Aliivibrio logei 5S-186]